MRTLISFILVFALPLTPYAYTQTHPSSHYTPAASVAEFMANFKTVGGLFGALQNRTTQLEFQEIVSYLTQAGLKPQTKVPEIKIIRNKIQFGQHKTLYDLSNLLKGKISNGKSIWGYNSKRSKLENIKSLQQYLATGNYKFSLWNQVLPHAQAGEEPLITVFEGLMIATLAMLITINLVPAGAALLLVAGVFISGAALLALLTIAYKQKGRISKMQSFDCKEGQVFGFTASSKKVLLFKLEGHLKELKTYCNSTNRDKLNKALLSLQPLLQKVDDKALKKAKKTTLQ